MEELEQPPPTGGTHFFLPSARFTIAGLLRPIRRFGLYVRSVDTASWIECGVFWGENPASKPGSEGAPIVAPNSHVSR